ncbi:class I tRNA ligase family protein [Sphaerisporangium sp. TRM90804]|uniref:class I tRNA ligase family protein n=1 Tax=Sphaerisporangium sp. TRM90804 TaxID=3031113 RepID=UPI00244A277E|nr:class I tRNA ligase family protein [Sphaerisporangium sp. TRM90804]MDH2425010.1 class I tRNA ligase family protein [Sphaerisporangium sp. TRM90804]
MGTGSGRLIRTAGDIPPRRYLLVPPEPTPNGRLHLGHIGGPFLRMDLLSRFVRMRGDRPLTITGSDVYEPYMTLKAATEGRTEGELAAEYHALIAEDLRAMKIDLDAFVNPAQEPWRTAFEEEVAGCLRRLKEKGAVVTRRERVPYSRSAGRFAVGPWLAGRCPDCDAETGSYFCEACGGHFQPENLRDARGVGGVGPLEWREISSLFLKPADPGELGARMVEMGVPSRYRETVRHHLTRDGGMVRVSAPEAWGIPLERTEPDVPRTLFPYAGIFMFARLAGALHGHMSGSGVNAFHPHSGVTTVTSLGIDNVIPTLVCIVGTSLLHGDMKAYDRALINDFYLLEGEKFSTGRKHAIWAADIAGSPRIDVDAVRYFLAGTRLEERRESMDPRSFVDVVNTRLAGALTPLLLRARRSLDVSSVPEPVTEERLVTLEALLDRQNAALDAQVVSTSEAVRAFDLWWRSAGNLEQSAYWWLKGTSVLGFPIMPGLSLRIWKELGGIGEPRLAAFLDCTRPRQGGAPWGFEAITLGDLAPLLPDSSRHSLA